MNQSQIRTPVVPPRLWYMLPQPPRIGQIEPDDCWAAGLASFQRATKINRASSRESLKTQYQNPPHSCLIERGTRLILNDYCVPRLFRAEGCELNTIKPEEFSYAVAINAMRTWGYLILIRDLGKDERGQNLYHTYVMYGIGFNEDHQLDLDCYNVMNPRRHGSYEIMYFSDANAQIIKWGHRRHRGPPHVHY